MTMQYPSPAQRVLHQPARRLVHRRQSHGFTLIELVISLTVVAVLVAVSIPSMMQLIMTKRVEGVANELATSLRLVRTLPLQTSLNTFIQFGAAGDFTCYAIFSDPGNANCDCTHHPANTCTQALFGLQPTEYKTVIVPNSTGVSLSANPTLLPYSRLSGLPNAGGTLTVEVNSSNGGKLKVESNGTGLPVICAVSGNSSYKPCS